MSLRCSHYSVAKLQQFWWSVSTANVSLKFKNVVPSLWIFLFHTVAKLFLNYCSDDQFQYVYIRIYKIILWFQGFGQEFFLSRPKYAIRGTGILGRIASFERRLRGAATTPLALPCPFRTSTWTRTDAERDKREIAKIPYVEKEFRRFWLNLNVCSARMIYKSGIIS